MLKKTLPLLFLSFGLMCCNIGSGLKLNWKEQTYKATEQNCPNEDCTKADFRYIKFEGNATADSLNAEIGRIMGSSYIDDRLVITSPEESAKDFIATYEAEKRADSSMPNKWMLNRELRVDTVFKNAVTLRFDESNFTGGAHGFYFSIFSHYQLQPYRTLFLADFLNNPSDTTHLTQIAEEIFRNKQELGKDENLEEAGYFFSQGIFRLNENFHFTEDGMVFHFNIYEIQPYSSGEYLLTIPYEKLSKILKVKLLEPSL